MAKGFKDKVNARNKALEEQGHRVAAAVPGISAGLINRETSKPADSLGANSIQTEITRPELQPGGQIVRVRIDEVYATKQVRPEEDFEEETLDGMKDSYSEVGMLTPPRCFPKDKNGYRIWMGETRWRSAKRRNDEFIDIYVGPPPEDDRVRILGQLIENVQQSGLKPLATAEGILELKTIHKMTGKQIAKSLGKPESYVSKHLRLVEAPVFIKSLLKDKVTADSELIYILTQVNDVSSSDAEKLAEGVRSGGLTRTDVNNELSRLKGKKPKSKPAGKEETASPAPVNSDELSESLGGAGDANPPVVSADNTGHVETSEKQEKPSSKPDSKATAGNKDKPGQVRVIVDDQEGYLLVDRIPDEYGQVWVRTDIGDLCVDAESVSITGIIQEAKK